MSPFSANGITDLRRALPRIGTLIPFMPLTAVLVLTGCANPSGPTSLSTTLVPTTMAVRGENGTSPNTTRQTYAVWGGRPDGYLTGAMLSITTSVGTTSYVASGPHATVQADVPITDTVVHIVITYPNFCFDQDVPVQTPGSPGSQSGTWLHAARC